MIAANVKAAVETPRAGGLELREKSRETQDGSCAFHLDERCRLTAATSDPKDTGCQERCAFHRACD